MKLTLKVAGVYAAILLVGGMIGYFIHWRVHRPIEPTVHQHIGPSTNQIWTCSMHPQIRQPEPGQCPICGMNLVPVNTGQADENPMAVNMSPTAMQLADVQTMILEPQQPVKEVRMNGKVQADERRVVSQSSHLPGRIEQLMVNFTGEPVTQGQVLAYIYSPDLVTAQEELFEAYKIRESQPALFQAARGKLRSWKLTEEQLDDILRSGTARERFPVLADVSGEVIRKRVNPGDYVRKGDVLFEIADLSRVWILFDVYESDMPWVRKGDEVRFSISSLPGESFTGVIAFIDPVLNPRTRVASARVEMPNPAGRLKPEMFAIAVAKSEIRDQRKELIIPRSAVMWTGERSVAYVKKVSSSGIAFEMREITLGPALGDGFLLKDGLQAGEEVAIHGTFSIDAAAQLAGKPSMMNPEGAAVSPAHDHGALTPGSGSHPKEVPVGTAAREALSRLLAGYLQWKDALVADDMSGGKASASKMRKDLDQVKMEWFGGEAHVVWMKHRDELEKALKRTGYAENIGEVRRNFQTVSDRLIGLAKIFGPFEQPLYIQYCPMANSNKGADWISADQVIQNPYFGKDMLTCGKVIGEIR